MKKKTVTIFRLATRGDSFGLSSERFEIFKNRIHYTVAV